MLKEPSPPNGWGQRTCRRCCRRPPNRFSSRWRARRMRITRRRFGNTILLYAPIYISNECTNGCLYCGFNATNKVPRKTLTLDETEHEARVLHRHGFRHVLLVTGEAPGKVSNDYLAAVAERIKPLFSSISIEVYPMETQGYRQMVEAGVDGLTVYQETYDRQLYAELHPFGKKRDYDFRLLTPERGGEAGLRRIGIGVSARSGEFSHGGLLHRAACPLPGQAFLAQPAQHFFSAHAPGGRQLPAAQPGVGPAAHPADLYHAPADARRGAGAVDPRKRRTARQPPAARHYPDQRRLMHRAGGIFRRGKAAPNSSRSTMTEALPKLNACCAAKGLIRSGRTGMRPS